MKTPFFLLALITLSSLVLPLQARDPFWPIGFEAKEAEVEPELMTIQEPSRVLSITELRLLAKQESDSIWKKLADNPSSGFIRVNDRLLAYVDNKWVSKGDTIDVEVLGHTYRLEITNLTSDNIELEAHRTVDPVPSTR